MITLRQYRETNPIPKSEYIFLDKMDRLFDLAQNGESIVRFNFTERRTMTNKFIDFIAGLREDKQYTIVMSTPDNDVPFIQEPWMDHEGAANFEYSDELQAELESKELDYFIDQRVLPSIPKNVKIFCHSVIKEHPSLNMVPLGRDFKGRHITETRDFDMKDKKILCYFNCSVPGKRIVWFGRIRHHIHQSMMKKDFVLCENAREYCNERFHYFDKYYERISQSKFMVSPRGVGIDCYRLWDCLYMGCIPIVVKYDGYKQFEDLPILFIEKWQDYYELTEDKLNEVWEEFQDREFNYDKLYISYWKNKITSLI